MDTRRARKLLGVVVAGVLSALLLPDRTDAQPAIDIVPGQGVRDDFILGRDVEWTLQQFERRRGVRIDRQRATMLPNGAGKIDTGYGIELHFDPHRVIWQIVVFNSSLVTRGYVHVFSHQNEVFATFGTNHRLSGLGGGYYLNYPQYGIGFDVDGRTRRVRAIVVFRRG